VPTAEKKKNKVRNDEELNDEDMPKPKAVKPI
jgi:hypothetical protein